MASEKTTSHYELLLRAYEKVQAKVERAKTNEITAKHYFKNAEKDTDKITLKILELDYKKAKYRKKAARMSEKIARLRLKAWEKTHEDEVKVYQLTVKELDITEDKTALNTEDTTNGKTKKESSKSIKKAQSVSTDKIDKSKDTDNSKKVKPSKKEVKANAKANAAEKKTNSVADFTVIEGIGPKINEILHAHNIYAFEQLAALDSEKIKAILFDAGNRLADPTTWGEQARLLAAGKMNELKALQAELKGGRVKK